MKSIFVMLAAYRDAECSPTIRDLYDTCSGKYRINVGVIWQLAAHETRFIDDFGRYTVRNKLIAAKDSLGCCWARSLAYNLYAGEDYLLSIDSHSRFAECWDEVLVSMLESLPAKSVISTYPASYTPKEGKSATAVPHTIVPGDIVNGILVPRAVACQPEIKEQYLVSCGFLFSRGYVFKVVPYDSNIYFNGEEPTLAARLWTHGWNLYSPGKVIVYHYYDRDSPRHWQDFDASKLIEKSNTRVATVLAGNCFDKYGLGSCRLYCEYLARL